TVQDTQAWSGLTRLAEVVEPMRPRLRVLAGENGRELFDLDGAPLADADRRRVMPDGVTFTKYAERLRPRSVIRGAVLAGGFLAGTWSVGKADGGAHVLRVDRSRACRQPTQRRRRKPAASCSRSSPENQANQANQTRDGSN